MEQTTTKTLRCNPTELTVGALQDFLTHASPTARVRIHETPGDRPFDSSEISITVTGPS